jgi:hypothetical protein
MKCVVVCGVSGNVVVVRRVKKNTMQRIVISKVVNYLSTIGV